MKTYFLIILLTSAIYTCNAQFQVGIKAGPSITYVTGIVNTTENVNTPKLSYQAGIFSNIQLTNQLSGNIELLFSNKGFAFPETPMATPPGPGILNLYYINLPLLINFNPVEKLSFQLGPEIGYLLATRSVFENVVLNPKEITGMYKNWEIGLLAGVKVGISPKVSLGLRYSQGIRSFVGPIIYTDQNGNPTGDVDRLLNQALQLSIYFSLSG